MNNILDKTKKLLGVSMAGMAALPMVTSCNEAQEQQKPMNVLFIMCDDHSYQTISAYDSTFIKTPPRLYYVSFSGRYALKNAAFHCCLLFSIYV